MYYAIFYLPCGSIFDDVIKNIPIVGTHFNRCGNKKYIVVSVNKKDKSEFDIPCVGIRMKNDSWSDKNISLLLSEVLNLTEATMQDVKEKEYAYDIYNKYKVICYGKEWDFYGGTLNKFKIKPNDKIPLKLLRYMTDYELEGIKQGFIASIK